jgi:hypothetical protein
MNDEKKKKSNKKISKINNKLLNGYLIFSLLSLISETSIKSLFCLLEK